MSLVTSKKMLLDAQAGSYAVGAFNAENMEIVKGIIAAAEELQASVMIGTTTAMIAYGSVETYAAMIRAEAEKASIPVCLHLDHGSGYELAVRCVVNGYTSVMIDGSSLPYEENIAVSKKVSDMAAAMGIPAEAELGQIGGNEDHCISADIEYTSPESALDFVRRTGVFSLAVSIGTAHGIYNGTPMLDIGRLKKIKNKVDIPLVLHGASGLTDSQLAACISNGICKVNFATDLRMAYTGAIKDYLTSHPDAYDPKEYGICAINAVKAVVMHKITVCRSAGI